MRASKLSVAAVVGLALVAIADTAHAQAYCALRDPVATIYDLYPGATGYRSIVATLDEQARADIGRQIGVSMHHDEMGRHTLYVALKGDRPIGLVHVRAERTRWGLAEVAWALDLDLRVLDFRIQRSRSASRPVLEREAFRSRVRGATADTLAAMVSTHPPTVNLPGLRLSAEDEAMALAVVTSGLKAIAATHSVWGEDLKRFRSAASAAR